jgi:1,4-dihydroxy-2-naphthoate octaprenyltransferase
VVNNYRDIETDKKTGKRTLSVILGKKGTKLEFIILLALGYMVDLYFVIVKDYSLWVLLPFLSAPLAFLLVRDFLKTEGTALNLTLARTAQLNLLFSILFAIGIVI